MTKLSLLIAAIAQFISAIAALVGAIGSER